MSDVDHLLHTTTRAVDVLKEQLREIAGDDEQLLHDTIEGEFDLPGLIAMAAEQNLTDASLVNGIKQAEEKLAARRDRIEKRISLRRVAILAAMQAGELRTVETPCGTISRKAVPPALLVLDEAKIPSDFWKPSDPRLDKKALTDALKSGRQIEGATLSNGNETIAVRT